MDTPINTDVSSPVASPDKLAGNVTHNRDWLIFSSIVALVFFALYFYKTVLEVRVAKQEMILNAEMIKELASPNED